MSDRLEPTIARLRYHLGGDRPVKLPTTQGPGPGLRGSVRRQKGTGWYFKVGSTKASAPASMPPTYPTQSLPGATAKLQ